MKPALFTTITPEHWRHRLTMARARRRERREEITRRIRSEEEARGLRAPAKGGRA